MALRKVKEGIVELMGFRTGTFWENMLLIAGAVKEILGYAKLGSFKPNLKIYV